MLKITLSDNILKNMKAAKAAYDAFSNASWREKVQTLKPGDPTPARGMFYDEANKDAFNKALDEYGADAKHTLKLFTDELNLRSVAAPNEDAARAISVFSMTPPTEKDTPHYRVQVDNMLRAYGSNPLAHEAIRSIAAKNGYRGIPKHPAIRAQEALDDIDYNVKQFFDGGHVIGLDVKAPFTDASVAFTASMIDSFINEIPEII